MNEMQIFNFKDSQVRTTMQGDEIYFVGKDVADILEYSNTSDALLRHVDREDKLTSCFTTSGQSREMIIINESGLYSLMLSSRLPSAKEFKRWVTSEVLPSIRKTGSYQVQLSKEQQVANALILANEMLQGAKLQLEMKEQQINELKPKADYLDRILKSKSLLNITQIAKDYGMSGTEFNKRLYEYGVQYKQRDQWLLYGKYQVSGYTSSETFEVETSTGVKTVLSTKWTQKGRLFIYDLLKKDGLIPSIEQ